MSIGTFGNSGEKNPILAERYRPPEPSCCQQVATIAHAMFTNKRNAVPESSNPAGGSDYRSGAAYFESDEESSSQCIIS